MSKTLTPLEQQLQQYAPEMFALHMLMKDVVEGGGGEKKILLLIDTMVKINHDGATGSVMFDYSKGRIANIDVRLRLTAGTGREL
jgi:hypothetical protein